MVSVKISDEGWSGIVSLDEPIGSQCILSEGDAVGSIPFDRAHVSYRDSSFSSSVYVHSEFLVTLKSGSRLFNGADLIETLGLKKNDLQADSTLDKYLISSAYRKWGEECPTFLIGEFAFAIWDRSRQRLFCCRDHMASIPLYYLADGPRFVFASDPKSVLGLYGGGFAVNRKKLAALAFPGGIHCFPEESWFAKVLSLAGGASITFDRHGIRKRNYWAPSVVPNLVPPRKEEAFEALRALLFRSVGDRLLGREAAGALLSGGLDSSAVVAIAARSLEKSNRSCTAISAVLPEGDRNGYVDERSFIDEFRTWPNVRIEYVTPAADAGPFDLLDQPERFSRTFRYNPGLYVYDAIQRAAVLHGLKMLLDGGGGELGPTAPCRGYHLELALRGRWLGMAKELSKYSSVQGVSSLRLLGGQVLSALFPGRRMRPLVYLTRHFAAECAVRYTRMRYWPDHRRELANDVREMLSQHADGPIFSSRGAADYCYPLMDKRLTEFCLSAPADLKMRDGYNRYLIRGALDGILPRRIQWRTTKAPFSPDYFARYNAQLARARRWIASIGPNDPVRAVVDIPRLLSRLVPFVPGQPRWEAGARIPATIYLICFLRQFPEFRL